jgi:hypothetical protein
VNAAERKRAEATAAGPAAERIRASRANPPSSTWMYLLSLSSYSKQFVLSTSFFGAHTACL